MFEYRQVLVRLRAGDSEREIARSRLMGREKTAALRALAAERGWLKTSTASPDDSDIVAVLGQARRAASTIYSVEPYREVVAHWQTAGVGGKAIHAALVREHGIAGSVRVHGVRLRASGALRLAYPAPWRYVSAVRPVGATATGPARGIKLGGAVLAMSA